MNNTRVYKLSEALLELSLNGFATEFPASNTGEGPAEIVLRLRLSQHTTGVKRLRCDVPALTDSEVARFLIKEAKKVFHHHAPSESGPPEWVTLA